jgi:hypothetical protein
MYWTSMTSKCIKIKKIKCVIAYVTTLSIKDHNRNDEHKICIEYGNLDMEFTR